MNILVTGASGFLGSHLVDELVTHGHRVTAFDLVPSQFVPAGVEMVIGDIRDRNAVAEVIRGKDAVYHFSGIADIEDCKNNPRMAMNINVGGTLNVLEGCVQSQGLPRLLFASSVYALSSYGNVYRTTKITCENLIKNFNMNYGLPYTIIRFGSLYGRRADERNSIHRFLKQALMEKKIRYKGSGTETREFIHVVDAAKLAIRALAPEYVNKDLLVTGFERFTYGEMFELIREILGTDIEVIMEPKTDESHYNLTPYSYRPDIPAKITTTEFIDFGQGLIDCLGELAQKYSIHEDVSH